MEETCSDFLLWKTGFATDVDMEEDLVEGVEADECEEEYMLDKLYEKVDLCSEYLPPLTFSPDNDYLGRISYFALEQGKIQNEKLWTPDGLLKRWFEGQP